MNQDPIVRLISVNEIEPSPYQSRRNFSGVSLQELAKSIERDGLIEPIVVRESGDGWEMIAGERRLRAVRDYGMAETILARVVEVDDLQARRMCAAENMQREDLSAVEQVEALVELIDAELIEDTEYASLGDTSTVRVRRLLGGLNSVDSNSSMGRSVSDSTANLTHKFVRKVEILFAALPKPVEWRSFYQHSLPLVTSLDADVRDVAIANKLNQSQAKALNELKRRDEDAYERLTEERDDDGVVHVLVSAGMEAYGDSDLTLRDMSAREIRTKAETLNTSTERPWAPALTAPVLPEGKFVVIYADPPWQYDFMRVDAWAVEKTYQTMAIEDLCAMANDIEALCVDETVLFLWATSTKLPEAVRLINAWGFEFKSSMVWIKHRNEAGMGYWARIGHELLLIGARKNASPPPPERRFPSVLEVPKGAHSEKPEEMRMIIEQMFPDARRLELFARKASMGWAAWGNEAQ